MKKRERRTRSISAYFTTFILIFLPLTVALAVVSGRVIDYTRSQTAQYLENTVTLYVQQIDDTLANVNRRMRTMLLGSTTESLQAANYIGNIETSENQALVYYSINQLKRIFYDLGQEYGFDINFFFYLAERDEYIRLNDGDLSQRTYRLYEGSLTDALRKDWAEPRTSLQRWRLFENGDGGSAVCRMYRKGGLYLGCWLRAEDLAEPMNRMDFGKNGYVAVCDEEGRSLTGGTGGAEKDGVSWLRNRFGGQMVITRGLANMPCSVLLVIRNYGTFERVLRIQLALSALLVLTIAGLVAAVYYAQRRLLVPIRNFSRSLQQIEEGYGSIEDLTHNDLQELDKANAEFIKLLDEVERLKATIYKQDVEKQTIQLDYLKMQIKPHFYLNCLNLIYNMIDLGEYGNARKMCFVTSNYMRYLFRNGDNCVTLEEELRHVRDYIEIQKMNYGNAAQFSVEMDGQLGGFLLPPLAIQTFVENAVKHAMSLDREFHVLVRASRAEGGTVRIEIRDDGDGFDPETLHLLTTEGSVRGRDGRGVGIDNCRKRLYHTYGNGAVVRFSNAAGGGAVVELELPALAAEERSGSLQ